MPSALAACYCMLLHVTACYYMLLHVTHPACMFLFLLLSPARLLGTSTKSLSWSVSGLELGLCLLTPACLGFCCPVSAVSLVSILVSLFSVSLVLGVEGLTSPWVVAGEGGSMPGGSPPATLCPAPGTATPWPGSDTGCCCCFGWGRSKNGWLKNASKSILSLASRLRRFTRR